MAMAVAQAGRGSKKNTTPGRPKKKETQFWDVGKVGRKTGLTLPSLGARDEHGLEPVSHIFSSPVSPRRGGALDSSDAHLLENSTVLTIPSPHPTGSGPDLDITLAARKTPRLPAARASTPKHTNIGSPKRASTGRPTVGRREDSPFQARSTLRPNRVLDFGGEAGGVRTSIETSPFKPRHVLRRSTGVGRENPFAENADVDVREVVAVKPTPVDEEDDDVPVEDDADEGAPMFGDDVEYELEQEDEQPDLEPVEEIVERSRPGRPRKSGSPLNNSLVEDASHHSAASSTRKRDRSTLEEAHLEHSHLSNSRLSDTTRAQKKPKAARTSSSRVFVHQDEAEAEASVEPSLPDDNDGAAYQDAEVDEEEEEDHPEPIDSPPRPTKKPKNNTKSKSKAPKPRDPNRAMRQVPLNESPSKLRQREKDSGREGSRSLSVGPISNVHLRASTPFEDAGRTSRFGRNLIQPLKYWANEMRIYKNGETAGIVRADPVSPKRRKIPPKKSKRKMGRLEDVDEEGSSETESCAPDEWEEEIGVVAGDVANWDPETQAGDPEDLVREDIAFAASSIIAKDVANTSFRYAKIMTLPFFGSGLVELPPGGEKRAKNCRRMQMCFFVHVGKVLVEVFAGGNGEGEGGVNRFGISRGGVWVVPRGNNYSIVNESRTKTAKIFFAQGCEVVEMEK